MNYYQLKDDNVTYGVIKTKISSNTMKKVIKKLKQREPDSYTDLMLINSIYDNYDKSAKFIQVKSIYF